MIIQVIINLENLDHQIIILHHMIIDIVINNINQDKKEQQNQQGKNKLVYIDHNNYINKNPVSRHVKYFDQLMVCIDDYV